MKATTKKSGGGSSFLAVSLLLLFGLVLGAHPALAQMRDACPLPAGVAPPADLHVAAQDVEEGRANLMDFALAVRDQNNEIGSGTSLEQVAYLGCRVRQEESPYRSGSTYLVQLTPDGRILVHAKDMALSGRQLHPLIYGAILQALGINPAELADPAAFFAAFAAAAAGDGASFSIPSVPGASGYAFAYLSANFRAPLVMLAGFDLGESHLAEETIEHIEPAVTARDVVDRATLKAFVTQAGEYVLALQESGDPAASSKARIALRDPSGPWRHGSVYLYVLDLNSNVILFHGAFPDRFELRPLVPTVRDAVTGEFVLPQVIAAAKSSPEGGFLEYYWDDPTDDTDRADIPKVGYARVFTGHVQRPDGSAIPINLIVGSGFYGTAPEEVAGDHDTVVESILPQVMRAMTAGTVDAVSGRIGQAAAGASSSGELSLGGASTLADVLTANGQALEDGTFDAARLLADSSFMLPLGMAETGDGGPFGNLTLWGSGDYRNLSGGSPGSVDYDGDVLSAHLGIDTRLSADLLAGVSVGRSRGTVDYTASGASTGKLTTTVTSINPYVGWQAPAGMSVWATVGHGSGEVEIEDAAGTQASDLTQRMAAAGLSGTLLTSDVLIAGGTTRLQAKGDAAFTEAEIDGSGTIAAATLEAGRQRLMIEGNHTRQLASGATVTPSVEIGMRNDVGDGETGNGVEVGGGLRYANEATGLTVAWRARTLLGHSGDDEEWGVSGLVRLAPGAAGRGLALSVRPAWGQTASGVQRLWATGLTPGAASAGQEGGRLDARVGYGMALPGGHFTGTPELGLGLSETGRDWRLGWRLGLAETKRVSFHLRLEGTRWEPANNDGPPEHRVGLTANMRW